MADRYNDNNSDNIAFDPNSQGQGPTQGQDQGQYDADSNRGDLAASDIRGEGRGPTQGQAQFDPNTRSPYPDSRQGDNPSQANDQSADPDYDRQDPARGRLDDQTRTSGPGGGQEYGHHFHHGQGQKAGDNVPYGGGGRDPRHGGHREQVVGDPQQRFDAGNDGAFTGAGPGPRPDDQEIRGDGNFGGKPLMPERVMGATEKLVGKATGNAAMYERGQQHKTGGY